MQTLRTNDPEATPVNAATKAAIEQGLAEIERGETVLQERAREIVRNRYKSWRKTQEEALPV